MYHLGPKQRVQSAARTSNTDWGAMRSVFTIIDVYVPGYKAGGPVRTIENMVAQLGDQFEFWLMTSDRDLDGVPYENMPVNQWVRVGKANVFYATPDRFNMKTLRRLLLEVKPDVVYVNSFFARLPIKYLTLRRLGLIPSFPTILAPRGEFSPSALHLKSRKKRVYIRVSKLIGLYSGLVWQATSEREANDIRHNWQTKVRIEVASNLPPLAQPAQDSSIAVPKDQGALKLVFLSRISPMKNLLFAIQLLKHIPGDVTFSIYGPSDDAEYWHLCQKEIDALPSNITVAYHGSVPHNRVGGVFADHHFFLLPTLGENFGHAILESLNSGCPVIISDRTPWGNLSKIGAGWVLPLDKPSAWWDVVTTCINMSQDQFASMSLNAKQFASEWAGQDHIIEDMVRLLNMRNDKHFNHRRSDSAPYPLRGR